MANTPLPTPSNSQPQAQDWAAQAMANSYGGAAPVDRWRFPPSYFVNPPLRDPAYGARADTGQYNYPLAPQQLFRGWLMESQITSQLAPGWNPPADPTRLYRLNFHFNPSDVTMDWSVTDPTFDPVSQQPAQDQNMGAYQTQGVTFGINLLLDREGDNHPAVVAWGGVNADIRILNAIMTSGSQLGQITYAAPAPVTCIIGRRYIQAKPTKGEKIVQDRAYGGVPKAYPLAVTGFMNSLSVDYQRFSSDMTPTRAVVSLSIQVLTWSPQTGTQTPVQPAPLPPNLGLGPSNGIGVGGNSRLG